MTTPIQAAIEALTAVQTCNAPLHTSVSQKVNEALAALQAAPAQGSIDTALIRVIECAEILNKRPRPMCRDCADEDGICPSSGLNCDMAQLFKEARAHIAQRAASADAPALTVWTGAMPESNGKSNFTATLMRKGGSLMDSRNFTFEVSEYPDRVRYEADCMRHLIGELAEEPDILAYDADKHSGYAAPAPIADEVAGARRAEFSNRVVLSVAEIPDRDSPEDKPEMMLVTAKELRGIIASAFEVEDEHPPAPKASAPGAPAGHAAPVAADLWKAANALLDFVNANCGDFDYPTAEMHTKYDRVRHDLKKTLNASLAAPVAAELAPEIDILAIMRPHLDKGDGGYLCDLYPGNVIAAGLALLNTK